MIVIIIFQPPPPLTIEIIISVNDENDGRPLRLKWYFFIPKFLFVCSKLKIAIGL